MTQAEKIAGLLANLELRAKELYDALRSARHVPDAVTDSEHVYAARRRLAKSIKLAGMLRECLALLTWQTQAGGIDEPDEAPADLTW